MVKKMSILLFVTALSFSAISCKKRGKPVGRCEQRESCSNLNG